VSGASERHAEVIPLAQGREARAARGAAGARRGAAAGGPGATRARCVARTAEGRPCRNYAVDADRCRVHARETAPADPMGASDAASSSGDATGTQAPPPGTGSPVQDGAGTGSLGDWPDDLGGASDDPRLPAGAVDGLALLRELGDRALSETLPGILRFLRRRLSGDYDIDVFGFDEDLTTNVMMPLLRPLHRSYWRVASYGTEHLPRTGGGLVVANHAGTLPADAMITRFDIFEATGRHARELGADLVFRTPFVGELGRKTGATLASGDDADRLLAQGELVAVWPEGYKGLGKPWRDRYKLQRFGRGGFVATALRAQAPIVPTAIVGSEEIYPLVFDLRIIARALGLPYFPVVAQMLALPVLGPFALLPLPSRWIIEYGEPIDTSEFGPDAADDPMVLFDLADQVRDRIQGMLHRNLMGRRSVFL
jgi:1-acyl-sn-glycerol-3-phosphate acyltransferase